jgi:hypothetical protein
MSGSISSASSLARLDREAPGANGAAARSAQPFSSRTLKSPALRAGLVLAVVLVAIVLRVRAVQLLPIDFDEDNYLRAGQQYRAALLSGDWREAFSRTELSEHPVLGKVIYGAVLAPFPPAPDIPARQLSSPPANNLPEPQLTLARMTTATFGVLTVGALALLDPLAGGLLAISTLNVRYSSEVMLEGFGGFFSVVAVLAYLRSRRSGSWLAVSGIALGLTAATKYVYAVAGLAIAIDWLLSWHEARRTDLATDVANKLARPRRSLRPLLAWGVLAAAIFLAADFYLWPDPLGRLAATLSFHGAYALGNSVRAAGYPMWQPLVWLSESVPTPPGVFLVRADLLIAVLGIVGLPLAWRRHRVVALWLIVGLAFLLVWPTKWPQYANVVTAPLSLAAAAGIRSLWAFARAHRPRVYQIDPGVS